jgi:hypothetical protein
LDVPSKKNLNENVKLATGKQSSLSKNQPNNYQQSPIKSESKKIRPSSSIADTSKF